MHDASTEIDCFSLEHIIVIVIAYHHLQTKSWDALQNFYRIKYMCAIQSLMFA